MASPPHSISFLYSFIPKQLVCNQFDQSLTIRSICSSSDLCGYCVVLCRSCIRHAVKQCITLHIGNNSRTPTPKALVYSVSGVVLAEMRSLLLTRPQYKCTLQSDAKRILVDISVAVILGFQVKFRAKSVFSQRCYLLVW